MLGNVFVLGDSYSTFWGYIANDCRTYYTEDYKESDVHRVEDTWWHRVISAAGGTLLENSSYMGMSICNRGYDGVDNAEFSFIGRVERRAANGFFARTKIDTVCAYLSENA